MLQETTLPKNCHFPNFTKMTQLLPEFSDFVTKLLSFLYNLPFSEDWSCKYSISSPTACRVIFLNRQLLLQVLHNFSRKHNHRWQRHTHRSGEGEGWGIKIGIKIEIQISRRIRIGMQTSISIFPIEKPPQKINPFADKCSTQNLMKNTTGNME